MSASAGRKRLPVFWFPLLTKELTEKANRMRTYWIRAAYALVFFGYFGFEGYDLLKGAAFGLAGLGTGAAFFEKVYRFQLFGTLLFLPALMSGLITFEKERDSLSLLLTTDLAPWRIILQKYLGGLMPMLVLQLAALPMTAVAYSLGGVEVRDLWMGAGLTFVHTLHMGAFFLACSAYCRSSVGAFLTAYLLGAIVFALLIPITSFRAILSFPLPPDPTTQEHQELLLRALPIVSIFWLVLATCWLRSRADVSRTNRLRALFLKLDGAFDYFNDKLGGMNLTKKGHSLPEEHPVQWRELHQRSLARPHYLIRLGLIVEVITVAVILWVASEASPWSWNEVRELTVLFCTLWALYALVLIVQGANIIASERTQQTLEVLLTTPMSGSMMVKQKSVVFGRIALMAIIPLGTVCWTEASMESMSLRWAVEYGLFSLISFIVVSSFIYWFSVAVGLRIPSRFKAILTALIGVLFLIALPEFTERNSISVLISPATSIMHNELGDQFFHPFSFSERGLMITNCAIIALFSIALRWDCLRSADRRLGRAGS
ncbi:MAG: ABC-type transport system involved in multi-copper enzyme maturation permease subunit [Verrucomicrobiales bacterium]|jgi:ABC-type transport system involved in multi-copper enzyme maturation permease subunit